MPGYGTGEGELPPSERQRRKRIYTQIGAGGLKQEEEEKNYDDSDGWMDEQK